MKQKQAYKQTKKWEKFFSKELSKSFPSQKIIINNNNHQKNLNKLTFLL